MTIRKMRNWEAMYHDYIGDFGEIVWLAQMREAGQMGFVRKRELFVIPAKDGAWGSLVILMDGDETPGGAEVCGGFLPMGTKAQLIRHISNMHPPIIGDEDHTPEPNWEAFRTAQMPPA